MRLPVSTAVFDHFSRNPEGPLWNVGRALSDAPSDVIHGLRSLLDAIPLDEVDEAQKDRLFRHVGNVGANSDHAARVWIAERYLSREIASRKLALLRSEHLTPRPAPYDLPPLRDLPIDQDHLVPISAFQFDGSRLLRKGFAFSLLTTTSAPNSSYWLLDVLHSERLNTLASVRLDPFLFGPEDQFPALFYRLWLYGRPLDWDRLASLRQPEHGRWLPGSLNRESEFTDFCWAPRPDGIHFICEEVPKPERCADEPSRYLHAIYNHNSQKIEHFDGALRLFTSEEIRRRTELHVRNGGKLGVREKVFRTDEPIDRERFSVVTQAFYIWNYDVGRYFTHDVALPSLVSE